MADKSTRSKPTDAPDVRVWTTKGARRARAGCRDGARGRAWEIRKNVTRCDRLLRQSAEFDNYRSVSSASAKMGAFGRRRLRADLLPVMTTSNARCD